ncbi:MAG: DNA polymerase/3'-5' exonuclease PolX [Phycisphaeraceae bacterium]
MPSNNAQLALIFQQMADVNQVVGGNRFKTIAFEKGARVLKDFVKDVSDVPPQDLLQVDGIGKGIVQKIEEFIKTGQVVEHQEMIDNVPAGVLQMLDIPGLGPKGVAQLWNDGGVESIDELKAKIDDGSLETLKGFGKKKLEKLQQSIAFAEKAGERTHLGYALPLALAMIEELEDLEGVEKIQYAGSLRRGKETIGDIDLLVAAKAKATPSIMKTFVELPMVEEVLGHGETKSSVRCDDAHRNIQVDLRVVDPKHYGAALMYFTGSKEHNVKVRERAQSMGFTLNEYALADKDDKTKQVETKTEEAIYKKLGLAWVPPELREDRGEIALAEKGDGVFGGLPMLIELSDIKADLHTHTFASDGKWSIEENALAMAARGHHTVAITDHSKGQVQANGLSDERLVQHIEAVREVAKKLKGKITVLAGSEVDILSDGRLDYPDELLAELDVVVASPHAALSQEPKKATARLLKAIENPYVTMIGHPTGRLVLRREGLSPDMEALIKAAADRGIALEINANHWRLDLRDTHARLALEHGVKLAINTDAHGEGDLTQLPYGVLTARRAGAAKEDVINCMTASALKKWLQSTRN